jgi:hypothetical protein
MFSFIFGVIGAIFKLVFGLIGAVIGLVFGALGCVLGLLLLLALPIILLVGLLVVIF